MKKLLLILLLTFTFLNVFSQNDKSFPTNIQEGNLEELEVFKGKVVAFNGTIEKIENTRNNTPFYKIKISENNYLWTALMFKNETNKIGDNIRVVGYLSQIEPNEIEKNFLDGKYIVVAFGLKDFQNSNLLFLEGAIMQKQEWIDGKIPSSK